MTALLVIARMDRDGHPLNKVSSTVLAGALEQGVPPTLYYATT
jgi:hypothetical protein